MARIYVASSWRNALQPGVVTKLRRDGHEVYDFREPAPSVREELVRRATRLLADAGNLLGVIEQVAYLAPLLGLLGTVFGLSPAFAAVATVNPAEKANLLSASISVAMNCTAFGLLTAVPLLFIHAWLQSRTTALIDSLEMASVKFLNSITERRPDAPAAA